MEQIFVKVGNYVMDRSTINCASYEKLRGATGKGHYLRVHTVYRDNVLIKFKTKKAAMSALESIMHI